MRTGTTSVGARASPAQLQSVNGAMGPASSSTKQPGLGPERQGPAARSSEVGEARVGGADAELAEPPKKRNLWWLKRRRKKRSRLTYIKTKYRRRDDERVPALAEEAAGTLGEEETELPFNANLDPAFEKPKRGRPPKGGAGENTEEELRNSSDPDWDESEEKKKIKYPVKKKRARFRKGSFGRLSGCGQWPINRKAK